MNRYLFLGAIVLIMLAIDLYAYQLFTGVQSRKRLVQLIFWGITVFCIVFMVGIRYLPREGGVTRHIVTFLASFVFMVYIAKILAIPTLLIDDLIRGVKYIASKFSSNPQSFDLSRSVFLKKLGWFTLSVPVVGVTFGIVSGAHDYRIRRRIIKLPNLPKSFDGIRIAQLSDIHSGSFYNKTAVRGGIEMLLAEKPDVIFFTGDLVNNRATEMKEYVDVFTKVKAPLGVFSTLGNHDYGDYVAWDTPKAKMRNLEDLKRIHGNMGWRLLMNEHITLEESGDKIAVLGVENWGGAARFPKYGDLKCAYQGAEDYPVKLLLSHDPSHWDAQIRPNYPDIDITFSGHTHGMQFGIDTPYLRWSPVQYVYKQWADLYQEGKQYLYVNRGYGYIGFPGRIGILPEITLFELKV